MSVYITGVLVTENVYLYNVIVQINLVKLILFYFFVMFSYNLGVTGVIFYFIFFILSFHFIIDILLYFIP